MTLHDALTAEGIRPPRAGQFWREGNHKALCPRCSDSRAKKTDPCLSVTIEDHGADAKAVWLCHHCQWSGMVGTGRFARVAKAQKVYRRPQVKPVPPQQAVVDWLASRGIPRRVVEEAGVWAAKVWMPQSQQKETVVCFPFIKHGELVNVKYREPARKWFRQEGEAEPCPFGHDWCLGERVVYVVEGEIDALSLRAVGVRGVMSAQDGAPSKGLRPDSPKLAWVETAHPILEAADKVVIATDADGPGRMLAQELIRRVGRERAWLVEWPDGCNDANAVLVAHGEEELRACLDRARPVPAAGEVDPIDLWEQIERLHEGEAVETTDIGFPGIDPGYRVIRGQVTTVTGWPNSGKSAWLDQVLVNLGLRLDGWRFAIFSPEKDPARHAIELIEKAARAPFFAGPRPRMSMAEVKAFRAWLDESFHWLAFDRTRKGPSRPDVHWLVERIEYMVRRYGIDGAVIDPFNRVRPSGQYGHPTEWVLDFLEELQACARRNNIHIWIVAHPAKQPRGKNGKRPERLTLQDIAGCYAADTEVMTARGWVPHAEVTLDDEVACFDPAAGVLRYARPSALHVYDHDGPMHHYTGYGLDLLVTPDHRMVVKPTWKAPADPADARCLAPRGRWSFRRSRDIATSRYAIPLAAPLAAPAAPRGAEPPHHDPLAVWRFVGWFVSEGSTSQRAPTICQAAENSGAPRAALEALGFSFGEQVSPPPAGRPHEKPMWRARLRRKGAWEFCDWIIAECGEGAVNKRLPAAAFSASLEAKRALFEALIAGDGTTIRKAKVRGSAPAFLYHTISPRLADDVQRLAIELGHAAHIRLELPGAPGNAQRYTVSICRADRTERALRPERARREVPYSGKVYCLTVPGGAYVTRRNGKMSICGNSSNWDNCTDMGLAVERVWTNPVTGEAYKPRDTPTRVEVLKARDKYAGVKGHSSWFKMDIPTGVFRELTDADGCWIEGLGIGKGPADTGEWAA